MHRFLYILELNVKVKYPISPNHQDWHYENCVPLTTLVSFILVPSQSDQETTEDSKQSQESISLSSQREPTDSSSSSENDPHWQKLKEGLEEMGTAKDHKACVDGVWEEWYCWEYEW